MMSSFPLTDPSRLGLVTDDAPSRTLRLLTADSFDDWLKTASAEARTLVEASSFAAKSGRAILLPGEGGSAHAIGIFDVDAPLWDAAALDGRCRNIASPPIAATMRLATIFAS